jgi:hypothetical protein
VAGTGDKVVSQTVGISLLSLNSLYNEKEQFSIT